MIETIFLIIGFISLILVLVVGVACLYCSRVSATTTDLIEAQRQIDRKKELLYDTDTHTDIFEMNVISVHKRRPDYGSINLV